MTTPAQPPPSVSDPEQWSDWMAAAQDGDRDAYRRLLEAITPYVRAIAARVLWDRSDIDDAVQDVLIAVHEARRTYDRSRPFKPWLAGVARHRIIDRMRARGRVTAREVSIGDDDETFASSAAKQDDMMIDSPALHRALAQLPPGQRVAIQELKLRESSLEEVAARTGLSVGALKVATHRGLKRLRQILTGKDGV